jgi:hypothetical protein
VQKPQHEEQVTELFPLTASTAKRLEHDPLALYWIVLIRLLIAPGAVCIARVLAEAVLSQVGLSISLRLVATSPRLLPTWLAATSLIAPCAALLAEPLTFCRSFPCRAVTIGSGFLVHS